MAESGNLKKYKVLVEKLMFSSERKAELAFFEEKAISYIYPIYTATSLTTVTAILKKFFFIFLQIDYQFFYFEVDKVFNGSEMLNFQLEMSK